MKYAILLVLAACRGESSKLDPPAVPPRDRIPVVSGAIQLDGELAEPAWNQRARRGVLVGDDGQKARPYSEVRLLHDATNLYIALYAADEDIRTTDRWELALGARALHVDAAGKTDAPDVRAGIDRDGTLDKPDDYDEEWVIELAVPLASLGAAPLAVSAKRCDTPKDGHVRCGEWHDKLGLE